MKAPPYLRQSAVRLAAGEVLTKTLWVIFGIDSWNEAKRRRSTQLVSVVFPDTDPAKFDWRPAAAFPPPVMLVQAGAASPNLADRLARAVIRDGVVRVLGDHNVGSGYGDLWERAI